MGILDNVRGLFGRPQSLLVASAATALAVPSAAPTQPEGISGGANYSGRLTFEPNEALRDQAGYGYAGTYNVGQWRELAVGNPYITAGLDFILGPVRDARVDVQPVPEEACGSGLTVEQAKLHADFVRWALTEAYRLPNHVEAAARGFLLSGFSLFEPVARAATWPGLPGRSMWVPAAIEQRLPVSLDPNPWLEDDAGHLVGIRQSGPVGMLGKWERPTIEASRALLYSWKREANNWAGESQFRSVWYIAGRIMPLLLKLAGVTVQREGAGLPVAFRTEAAKGDLTPRQRDDLIDFMANSSFHESSGVVLPQGWDMKWIFSPGSDKTFILDMWKSLGLVVLQQASAQQLVLGTDNTGARSVGEVHDARSMAFVRKVLAFVEGVLNGDSGEAHTGLVQRLVEWNFGPQSAYPRIKLTPQRPEMAAKDLADSANTAKSAGLFTPTAKDELAFRERAGLPSITEEERDAAKAKAAALAPALPQPGAAPPVPGKPQLQASMPRAAWQPWRPLRASEQRTDWAALDKYFVEQRDVFERSVRPVVVGMLAKAAPLVAGAMADGKVSPEEVAAIPLDATRLSRVVSEYLAKVRAAGGKSTRDELARATKLRAEEGEEEEDDRATIEKDADEVVNLERNRVVRRITQRTRAELEREAIDALRTGGDAQEVVDRAVSRQLDTGAFKTDAGAITTKAFNVGRDEAARILGGVASVEYSALLDSATCEACAAADGETADFNSAEHDKLLPPNRDCAGGDNCRCVLVFIPEGDE